MSASAVDRGSLYLPTDIEPAFAQLEVGQASVWRGREAQHAAAVRRLHPGETVSISDGAGLTVTGTTIEATRDTVRMTVTRITHDARPRPTLTLVQALAKGDRDERAIESATELGVDRVIPWQASRSIAQWRGPKQAKGEAKWKNIVTAATKQSLRSWVPEVLPLATMSALRDVLRNSLILVLDPRSDEKVTDAAVVSAMQALAGSPEASQNSGTSADIALIVGPEGGISADELATFAEWGARRVLLGTNVLRTSTAGPTAIAVIQTLLARW